MRLTPYGACAAAGVLGAMALSGRAARRLGINSEAVWDAGLFGVLSCFAVSRLLLVLSDPVAFAHYPLLVLGLPSLTIGGLGLAGVAVLFYLRRKRLPVLTMLDAFAPCGAVLAAFLELGHWLDGSEPGMPVLRGGIRVVPGYRPVSVYGLLFSMVLALWLWTRLSRERPGRVAAQGLVLGGLAAYGLSMISLPVELFGTRWLEPGQMVALASLLTGALLWTFAPAKAPDLPLSLSESMDRSPGSSGPSQMSRSEQPYKVHRASVQGDSAAVSQDGVR